MNIVRVLSMCGLVAASGRTHAAGSPAWTKKLAEKVSAPALAHQTDRQLQDYFGRLLVIKELFGETCNPILSIKAGDVPVTGALGSVGHVAACPSAKPLLFMQIAVAAPEFETMRDLLAVKLRKPCFDGPGPAGSPAMAVWADEQHIVGLTQGAASGGFTLFVENLLTGPSADPEGEAALRRDLNADIPKACL